MSETNFFQNLKRKAGIFFRKILTILAVLAIIAFSISYWGTYETGVMSGRVLMISGKGIIFKTYEGKLNIEAYGSLKGVSPIAETFDFSVAKDDSTVISELQKVSLSGERVNLHYAKRYLRYFWRGDTKYFITRVERSGQ